MLKISEGFAGYLRSLCWLAAGAIFLAGCTFTAHQPVSSDTPEAAATETAAPETVAASRTAILLPTSEATNTATPVIHVDSGTTSPAPLSFKPYGTFTATLKPTITQTGTEGPTPRFTRTFTPTPTRTNTPSPGDAVLRISRPGLYSKITSPYKIEVMVTPGEDGYVYLSLVGEDQRIIYSQALDYRRAVYSRFLILPSLEFTIPKVAETARLTLETRDLYGRISALSSVDIILLSIGDNETNPSQRLYQSFIFDSPKINSVIEGGRLLVSGRAAPLNSNPLIIELVDENGEILASRSFQVEMPEENRTYTAFVIELPYVVLNETQARLSIRQESDNRLPGTIALASTAVRLLP